jgi:TonB family protein
MAPPGGPRIPPTPKIALPPFDEPAAASSNLYVLSVDEELIETVRGAVGEHCAVLIVTGWPELEAAIETGNCAIALLDADLLGKRLSLRIDDLDRHAARTVVLAAAGRRDAEGLMSSLSDRKIHRLLIKPSAPGITRLLVESAIKRSRQLRDSAPIDVPVDQPELPVPPRAVVSRRAPVWIYVAACAALLAGIGVVVGVSSWWRTSPSAVPMPARVEAEPEPTRRVADVAPVAEGPLPTLMSRAELATRDGRLTAPAGDNALEYYLAVLAVEPSEPVAREKLAGVLEALFGQAEAALLAGAGDTAADVLGHIRRAEPTSGRLLFLEAQLERARAAARAESAAVADSSAVAGSTARRPKLDAEPTAARSARAALQHAEWLASARQRLGENALVSPVGDNAYHYLATLQAEAPDFPGIAAAWRDWTAALSREIGAELAARRWESAAAMLDVMRRAPSAAAAEPLVEQLAFALRQEQYLATAVPASEFTLLESVTPVYPELAERRGQEGWVDLEFTIDTAGRVADVVVGASEPPGRFDAAAAAAVTQYRYAPFNADGRPYSRRARLRVRFTLR